MAMKAERLSNAAERAAHQPPRAHHTNCQIAIGRASRPFPRSKRSRPVSRHSAFQLDRNTLTEQTCRFRQWSAPAGQSRRHLLSPLRLLTISSYGLPWQPSPCPPHYSAAFGYYVASALRLACWHFRTPCGSSDVGGPSFQSEMCGSAP